MQMEHEHRQTEHHDMQIHHPDQDQEMHAQHEQTQGHHYARLLMMAVLSFLSMYILMYAMVHTFGNALNNFNQVYMAGLMTAPMIVIEVLLMSSMYKNRKLNTGIIAASVLAGILFFLFIRQQSAIGDRQFLKSMIPHHSGAILMCEQASIDDPEIEALCQQIIESQREEIDQMTRMLEEMEN